MKDVFGRLSKGPHPELHRLLYAPAFDHDVREVLPLLVRINAAHVVMLEQCGILDAAEAAALLRANDAIAADPPAAPESSRGLYAVFEAELISRCGPIAGGSVHTARSRNDINATVARLRVRACLLRVAGDLLALQSALIERAAEHRASLMPGFTHLQPAQPTTFGHYLLGVAAEFDRTASRLLDVDGRMDECPMGACAGFGTSLPIRPHLVADLLGFARPVPSALDAVASRDFVPEFLSIAALAGMTLTRLATDLQSWASPAWGFLGWPDELVSTSSIMPQKRNAFVLESLRGRAAGAAGGWVSAMVGMKNTPFANGIEVSSDVVEHAPRAAADTSTALQLMTLLMRHVTVDAGRLEAAAGSGDITATALADALVRSAGVAFRAAHEAVAGLVTADVDRTNAAAVAAWLGRALDRPVDPGAVAAALDAKQVVAAAAFGGGPAASSLAGQQSALEASLAGQRRQLDDRRAREDAAGARLRAGIDRILAGAA